MIDFKCQYGRYVFGLHYLVDLHKDCTFLADMKRKIGILTLSIHIFGRFEIIVWQINI